MRANQFVEGSLVRIAPPHRRAFNVFGRLSPDRDFLLVGKRDGKAMIALPGNTMSKWQVPFTWIDLVVEPRIGRPPAAEEARGEKITVRATSAESASWRAAAAREGIVVGEWMRRVLNAAGGRK
jgi:hypothetical protein